MGFKGRVNPGSCEVSHYLPVSQHLAAQDCLQSHLESDEQLFSYLLLFLK